MNATEPGILLVARAAAFAAQAHVRQQRKVSGDPYINHPLRVAERAALFGLPAEAVAAALLHDVVEDTTVTLEELRGIFPKLVVELVGLLTQSWVDHAPEEIKRIEAPKYYGAILKAPLAVELKLLDRADNLREMARTLPRGQRWAERYLRKTESEFREVLKSSRNGQVREEFVQAKEELRYELSALQGRGSAA